MKKKQNADRLVLIKKKVLALKPEQVKGGLFNSPRLPTDACPSYQCHSATCC